MAVVQRERRSRAREHGPSTAVAALAFTNRLAQALTQLSWVPCDGGSRPRDLAGEHPGPRLRQAVVVMVRVYLALAGSVACVILAVNPAFVRGWVGLNFFAGSNANILIALLVVAMTFGHALAVVSSVLGQRFQLGVATLVSGVRTWGSPSDSGPVRDCRRADGGVISHGLVFRRLPGVPCESHRHAESAVCRRSCARGCSGSCRLS
jgi:hypothetical protein